MYNLFTDNEEVRETLEYVALDPFRTVKEAHDMIDKAEEQWEAVDAANYIVRPAGDQKDARELAGHTVLECKWELRTARFGLVLTKPFWGRGYSGERAAALMKLAFETLDLELVAVGYNEGNERSKRAIEKYVDKFNGQYDGVIRNRVPMEEKIHDFHRYTVTREQYNATPQLQKKQCRFVYE